MNLNNYIIPLGGKIINATFDEINQIIKKIPKKEHKYIYNTDKFTDSPLVRYRDAIKNKAFIDIYSLDDPSIGIIVVAVVPSERRKGLAEYLIKRAINILPKIKINKLIWKVDSDNSNSINLARKLQFVKNEDESTSRSIILEYYL